MRKNLTAENPAIVYNKPTVKVIGLGGGGCNAVDRIIRLGYAVEGVEFIAANTDIQSLQNNLADTRLLLGPELTHGRGSGGNPVIGEKAALESEELLRQTLQGADIVFLTAGMGGGTGSGSIGVAARVAHELGAITISIVNTPFSFEAGKRAANAREYLTRLAANSDTLITLPNDQILKVAPRNTTLQNAFAYADDVLRQGIVGIARLLTDTGEINVDFSHVRDMMQNGGGSILSIGYGKGINKVSDALYQALNHPLLEHLPIENATGIIANFTGDENLSFNEVMTGLTSLQTLTNYRADIIPGQIVDRNMHDEVQIILIITGIASIPVESVVKEEKIGTAAYIPAKPAAQPAVVEEPVLIEEPVPVMAYAEAEADTEIRAEAEMPHFVSESRLYPTLKEHRFEVSPAADAAFDTFMEPFGYSSSEKSSFKPAAPSFDREMQNDLDVPTFIRRRM